MKTSHVPTAFDGEGARRFGGRWNSPGVSVAYAAESVALAALEILANLQSTELLASYSLIPVDIPRSLITELDAGELPDSWREFPPPATVQAVGDAWVASERSAVLRVPSVLVPESFNYLVNVAHPEAKRLRVGKAAAFRWDGRLVPK